MAHLILIAGGSAAGKSCLARRIGQRFPRESVLVLSHDRYYHDVSRLRSDELVYYNFDHPDALDHEQLITDMEALVAGGRVGLPDYDFVTHARLAPTAVGPVDVVILEGILALCFEPLVEMAGLRLFVDTDADVRLIRRLERDVRDRDFTYERALEAYQLHVKPMHDAFVEPSRKKADMIIPGDRSADRALRILDGYVLRTLIDDVLLEREEADARARATA